LKHSASALLLIALLSPASLASPATTADETTRYLRVQDGELFPCPGGTDTEGADIDAVQILSVKP